MKRDNSVVACLPWIGAVCLSAILSVTVTAASGTFVKPSFAATERRGYGPIVLTNPGGATRHTAILTTRLQWIWPKARLCRGKFFIEGRANAYNTPPGPNGSVKDTGHPFKTRIVVRRPSRPRSQRYSDCGMVQRLPGPRRRIRLVQSVEHVVRRATPVGVSNQRVGVTRFKNGAQSLRDA